VAHVELSLSEAFVPHASTPVETEYGGSVELWAATVAAAGEPCLLINAEWTIVAVSDEGCRLLRMGTPAETTGRSLLSGVLRLLDFTQARGRLPETEMEAIPPLLALTSGRLARGLMRLRDDATTDGTATVDAIATPLSDGGRPTGSLTFFAEV
jgi:hypothetical protein